MINPEYKIGDVVLFKGLSGFVQQGVVRAATLLPIISWSYSHHGYYWKYYVSSRNNSRLFWKAKIIGKV